MVYKHLEIGLTSSPQKNGWNHPTYYSYYDHELPFSKYQRIASWQPLCPGLLDRNRWVVSPPSGTWRFSKRESAWQFHFGRWYWFHSQEWMGRNFSTKTWERCCLLKCLLILSTVVNHHFEQNHLGEYFLVHFFHASWPSKSTCKGTISMTSPKIYRKRIMPHFVHCSAEWWTKTTSTIVRFQYVWKFAF